MTGGAANGTPAFARTSQNSARGHAETLHLNEPVAAPRLPHSEGTGTALPKEITFPFLVPGLLPGPHAMPVALCRCRQHRPSPLSNSPNAHPIAACMNPYRDFLPLSLTAVFASVVFVTPETCAQQQPVKVAAPYSDWGKTGTMTILTTPEGANLPAGAMVEGFPLLVRLHSDWFDFSQAKAGGEDIRFTAAGGAALAYQIEQWDAAKGTASVWLRVPKIQGNERQAIHLHWGKPDAASESNGAAVFSADNGFVTVVHMDGALKDEHGAIKPKDEGTTAGDGMAGECRSFTKGKGISGGDHVTTYPFGDNPFTAEAWFRSEGTDSYILYYGRYATRLNGKTGDGNEVGISIGSPASLGWASDGPGGASGETVPRMGQWYHVAATYEDGVSRIFVNGKLDGTRNHPKAMSVVKDVCMDIGGMRNGNYRFVGDIDEVRISKLARSEDWLKLSHENQKDQQTLVGPVVQQGGDFIVTPATATVDEGSSVTFTVKAGGAQKLYWLGQRPLQEGVVATDRFSFTLTAPRVSASTSLVLRCRAIFATGEKTIDVPVTIREHIPEPGVEVKAPAEWNGRDTIEIAATTWLKDRMAVKDMPTTKIAWKVAGGAVLKEVAGDKLLLKRSQFTGKLFITAAAGNGGEESQDTVSIVVTEPKSDPWVQRTPAKQKQIAQ